MKSKQEVIQEAWGKYWDELKEFICENGWLSWGYRGLYGDKNPASLGDMYRYCGGEENHQSKYVTIPGSTTLFRPKSLAGIEKNNGWTRIESEDDLPTSGMKNYMYCVDGKPSVFVVNLRVLLSLSKDGMVSHYMALPSPEAPIY